MSTNRRGSRLIVIIFLVFAAAMTISAGGQEIERKKVKTPVEIDNPLLIFNGIENAWKAEDAAAIARFAGKNRVYMDVRGTNKKGGYFSKSQVFYLFKDIFKSEDQVKFEFVKFHNLDNPDRRVYGIAYRSCKNNRSGKVFQDKVYVTLGREGPAWVVTEIKTTR